MEMYMGMIKEKPWFGHGYKSFEAKYMLYQADYFEQNKKATISYCLTM